MDQNECAVVSMAKERLCCSTWSPCIRPGKGCSRKIPVVTKAVLGLMSWRFCTISEDQVAGAVTSLLEFEKERKDIVIPPRSWCCYGLALDIEITERTSQAHVTCQNRAGG